MISNNFASVWGFFTTANIIYLNNYFLFLMSPASYPRSAYMAMIRCLTQLTVIMPRGLFKTFFLQISDHYGQLLLCPIGSFPNPRAVFFLITTSYFINTLYWGTNIGAQIKQSLSRLVKYYASNLNIKAGTTINGHPDVPANNAVFTPIFSLVFRV